MKYLPRIPPRTLKERGLRNLALARTNPLAPWSAEGPMCDKNYCIASMNMGRFRAVTK